MTFFTLSFFSDAPVKGDSQRLAKRPIVEYQSLVLTSFFRLSIASSELPDDVLCQRIMCFDPFSRSFIMFCVALSDNSEIALFLRLKNAALNCQLI